MTENPDWPKVNYHCANLGSKHRKWIGLPQSTNKADNAEKIPKRRRKPAFEGRIETAVFEATDDGVVDIKTSVEQLQPDAEEVAGEKRSHWDDLLSHTISVDGERIPGKLLHQCSIEHGFVKPRGLTSDNEEETAEEIQDKDSDEFLRTERSLVEQELRKQRRAPSDISIRDLLAKPAMLEAEDDEEEGADVRIKETPSGKEKGAHKEPVASRL